MSASWAQANPEKWRQYKRDWYARNRGKAAGYKRKWDAANPSSVAKRAKAYRVKNREARISKELLRAARRRAKDSGIECTITLVDITVPTVCPLLGIPLFPGEGKQGANSPSLDRIENDKGYVCGNVWVISHKANACKRDLRAEEIIQIGERLKAKVDTLRLGAAP